MILKLIAIQLITFIGVAVVLRFLFSKNLQTALGRLNALHEENLVKENELESELKVAKEERDAQVQRGAQEAQVLIDEAKKEILIMKLQAEEQARQQAAKLVAQSKEEAESVRGKARDAMAQESLAYAIDIIAKVFTERNARDMHGYFIEEVLEEISRLPPEKFLSAQVINVVTCRPLSEDQRRRLRVILESKTGQSPVIQEAIDKSAVSGLSVEMGGMVIDGTLRNRLNKVVSHATGHV
jgi:F0F1-type ATP synthase delta subunit